MNKETDEVLFTIQVLKEKQVPRLIINNKNVRSIQKLQYNYITDTDVEKPVDYGIQYIEEDEDGAPFTKIFSSKSWQTAMFIKEVKNLLGSIENKCTNTNDKDQDLRRRAESIRELYKDFYEID